jgi:GT2 family glycosyltransferase
VSVSHPKVAILILNWNGKKWLAQFLPSVLQTTYPNIEIWVVDNASSDDSVAFVKEDFPTVKILQLNENHGFALGNNMALPHIDTPYYVLLNSDVEVAPNWLEAMVAMAERDEKIAAIQPKIRAFHDKEYFEYAGAAGGWVDELAYPFCEGRIFDVLEKDEGQYDSEREIFWATGACCFVRKSVTNEIGLFEPLFFAHMEEIDFCWRAKNFGYKIMYEPNSMVWHVGGGTLHKSNPRKLFLNVRNSLAMMLRNLPTLQIIPKIFLRLCLDGVFGIHLLLFRGDWKSTLYIIKAHFAFYGNLPYWLSTRKKIYQNKIISFPQTGVFRKSIVWKYFGQKKKTFKELHINEVK